MLFPIVVFWNMLEEHFENFENLWEGYANLMGAPWEPFGNLVITLLGHFGNTKTFKNNQKKI
jgi:hypothetical protein